MQESIRKKCKFCEKMFTKRRLRQHVRKEHDAREKRVEKKKKEKRSNFEDFEDSELKFKCSCGDRFETKMHLERHIMQDLCGATIYGCSVSIFFLLCLCVSSCALIRNVFPHPSRLGLRLPDALSERFVTSLTKDALNTNSNLFLFLYLKKKNPT